MPVTELGARTPQRASRGRTRVGSVVVSAACLVALVAAAPSAQAEPGQDDRAPGTAFPSREQVSAAQDDVRRAADQVAAIRADLAAANQRLESSAMAAEQAAEAYNGARWRVEQAAAVVRQTRHDARRAARQVDGQRDLLASLVAAAYQDGGDVSAVNAVLDADGPELLMSQILAYEGANTSAEAQVQRFSATATLAEVFRSKAVAAKAEQERLLARAEQARAAAAAAAESAQQAAAAISAQRTALVARLADLEHVSVRMAERRQSALEEIQRRRAARAAAAQAAADAAAAEAAAEAAAQAQSSTAQDEPGDGAPAAPSDPPAAAPATPAPPPAPPVVATPPAPQGGAARAVAFARAQLGEPYVWGAAGPGSWDCSGLMMGAWQAGGVALPHYSAAQYAASTPISADQLRPGDLLFWGTTSSPSSIHHVAMYLGDGLMIHAPRTGRPVSIDSVSYWIPPNFFGRP